VLKRIFIRFFFIQAKDVSNNKNLLQFNKVYLVPRI